MSREVNRAARRSEARKAKNRKTGMMALSLMATTSLFSSYVSLLRTQPSFASYTEGCSSVEALQIDVSGSRSEDVARIATLQSELVTALSETTARCVTVTFNSGEGAGEDVLNFTRTEALGGYDLNVFEELDLFSETAHKVIFVGNDVTLDFVFEDTEYGPNHFTSSPIETGLALDIHDITFRNSSVLTSAPIDSNDSEGGVIRAFDNLAVYGSAFINNTVRDGTGLWAPGGAIFAGNDAVISDTVFRDNSANGDGGAVYVRDNATITASTFEGNSTVSFDISATTARNDDGGAVWAHSDLVISGGSNFFENYSNNQGGAVYLAYASWSGEGSSGITNSTFTGNSSSSDGGAVYVENASFGDLGFVSGDVNRNAFTVENSTFEGNSSGDEGGAIGTDAYTYVTGSTFTSNLAEDDGGAIYADDGIITVFDSTFLLNSSQDDGGAIYFDGDFSVVRNSTFDRNSTQDDGGAVYADEEDILITNSYFVANYAASDGGAIYLNDNANYITNSTFVNNSADGDGGAIYLEASGVQVSNSTFASNSARDQGGAIYAASGNTVAFNTFLNNLSDDEALPEEKNDDGESLSIGEGSIVGNIFAGDPEYPQIELRDGWDVLEYNLSTGDDFAGAATNSPNVSEQNLHLDAELQNNETTNFSQTLAIKNKKSEAFGFVPLTSAENFLGLEPTDQRGVRRTASNVNAGAFEGSLGQSTGGVSTYIVFDVKPESKKPRPVINVSGWELMRVTEVYVNGTKVDILSQSATGISFKLPFKAKGPVEIRLVGAGLEDIHILNLDGKAQTRAVVPGFGSNSTKLTKAMKKEIRSFVEANPGLTTAICKGFTSAPATRQDLRLARERGQAACDYIRSLYPELTVKVLPGSHTNTPGQKVRRVRIEMQ